MLQALISGEEENSASLLKFMDKILSSSKIMNLKVTFTAVTCLLQRVVAQVANDSVSNSDSALKSCTSLLEILRKNDLQSFNQIILLHLKQTQDPQQKRLIRNALQTISGE